MTVPSQPSTAPRQAEQAARRRMLTLNIDIGGTLSDGLFGDGESATPTDRRPFSAGRVALPRSMRG